VVLSTRRAKVEWEQPDLSRATQTLDELSALPAGNCYPATTAVVHQLRQLAVKGHRFDASTRIAPHYSQTKPPTDGQLV